MIHNRMERKPIQEGLITALAIGGTFILLGLVIVSIPNFISKVQAFFNDFGFVSFPFSTGTISFPAPRNPSLHLDLFTATMNFAIGIAVLQSIILPLRILAKSRLSRIAETVGNLVFWIGTAIVASTFLLAGTQQGWFQYWAFLIVLAGVSLIVRGAVEFMKKSKV